MLKKTVQITTAAEAEIYGQSSSKNPGTFISRNEVPQITDRNDTSTDFCVICHDFVLNRSVIDEVFLFQSALHSALSAQNWAVTIKNSSDPVDTITLPALCSKNSLFTVVWKHFGGLRILPCESEAEIGRITPQ